MTHYLKSTHVSVVASTKTDRHIIFLSLLIACIALHPGGTIILLLCSISKCLFEDRDLDIRLEVDGEMKEVNEFFFAPSQITGDGSKTS